MASATVRLIGGPTLVIEAGGLRLLTDPTFDQPGPFDVVLLSHDQHGDDSGLLERVPLVLTTSEECIDDVRAAFARHGLSDRLRVLAAGDMATI
jgi:L-ascorbate metabolism protein UlaG (beta-lactamase superfamily)